MHAPLYVVLQLLLAADAIITSICCRCWRHAIDAAGHYCRYFRHAAQLPLFSPIFRMPCRYAAVDAMPICCQYYAAICCCALFRRLMLAAATSCFRCYMFDGRQLAMLITLFRHAAVPPSSLLRRQSLPLPIPISLDRFARRFSAAFCFDDFAAAAASHAAIWHVCHVAMPSCSPFVTVICCLPSPPCASADG